MLCRVIYFSITIYNVNWLRFTHRYKFPSYRKYRLSNKTIKMLKERLAWVTLVEVTMIILKLQEV